MVSSQQTLSSVSDINQSSVAVTASWQLTVMSTSRLTGLAGYSHSINNNNNNNNIHICIAPYGRNFRGAEQPTTKRHHSLHLIHSSPTTASFMSTLRRQCPVPDFVQKARQANITVGLLLIPITDKVIWQKAASQVQMDSSDLHPIVTYFCWTHVSHHSKWRVNLFSGFGRAHECD